MKIVVISPEGHEPREVAALGAFLSAGLEAYHVRKPDWSEDALEEWLGDLPADWRPRLVLHEHARLVGRFGLGALHLRDQGPRTVGASSRSCHDLATLAARMGRYRTLFYGPVFPSLTKRGYGPQGDFPWHELSAVLRSAPGRESTRVLAIGGVTESGLAQCRDLGFDGAAVMGAVWNAQDPARALEDILREAASLGAPSHVA